jgi:hypothetical protein
MKLPVGYDVRETSEPQKVQVVSVALVDIGLISCARVYCGVWRSEM